MKRKNLFGEEVDEKKRAGSYGYRPKLIHEYELDEVVSALQKCVRRGLERDAVYWAAIMYKSGFSKYLMRRLATIAHEDIGISNPVILVYANQLKMDAEGKKVSSEKEKATTGMDGFLPVVNFIVICCRSLKTRIADELANLVWEQIDSGIDLPEIPEIARDPHTQRGKQEFGRWNEGTAEDEMFKVRLWYDYWSLLKNEDGDNNIYREELKERWGYYGESKNWKAKLSKEEVENTKRKSAEYIRTRCCAR